MGTTCCTLGDGGAATTSTQSSPATRSAKHGSPLATDLTVAASIRRLLVARNNSKAATRVDERDSMPQRGDEGIDDSAIVAWRSNVESLLPLLTTELQEALSANATAGLLQNSRSAAASRAGAPSSVGSSGATISASASLSLDGAGAAGGGGGGAQDLLQLQQKAFARESKRTVKVVECCYFFAFEDNLSTRAEALPEDLGSVSFLRRDSEEDDDDEQRRFRRGGAPPQDFVGVGPRSSNGERHPRHIPARPQGASSSMRVVAQPAPPPPARPVASLSSTTAADGKGCGSIEIHSNRLIILSSYSSSAVTKPLLSPQTVVTPEPSMSSFTNVKPVRGSSTDRSGSFFLLPRVVHYLKFLLRHSRYTTVPRSPLLSIPTGGAGPSERKTSSNSNNATTAATLFWQPGVGNSLTMSSIAPADPRRPSSTRSRGAIPQMHHCTIPVDDAAALPSSCFTRRNRAVGDDSIEASSRSSSMLTRDEPGRSAVAVSAVFLTHDVADCDCRKSGTVTLGSRPGAVLEGVLFLHYSEDADVVAKLRDEEDELLQQYCARVPLEGAVRNFLSNVYQTTVK